MQLSQHTPSFATRSSSFPSLLALVRGPGDMLTTDSSLPIPAQLPSFYNSASSDCNNKCLDIDIEQVSGGIFKILIQPQINFGRADTAVPKAQLHLPQVCPSLVG